MPRLKPAPVSSGQRKRRPATNPEDRENQLIALAYDAAEERIRNGTASSQEIVHFLKLGSTKERIEKEILERQKELITAKTDALQSSKMSEELYQKVIQAIGLYTGSTDESDVQ